ncbi:hypothetical protein GCM10023093_01420 [Nemorincola caseinilytica]|uniref:Mucoidy inhibitor MuiA family protein n=1 Tax=Nemorincola caseinilytica TaxID=2054315 RepID=A0ABP8N1P3_9BACT
MHKRSIIIAALVATATGTYAQQQQKLNIEQATVFLHGAQLTSTAKVRLQKGENEFLFTNVAGDINTQSLSVNAGNGVVVESAVFQNNYLVSEVLSPRAREIKDSIDIVSNARSLVTDRITTITEQVAVLQANRKVGGENTGLSVAELTKMLDLVNTRMEGYLNQKHKQEEQQKKMDEYIARLRKQLDEENKKGYQPGGQLLVKFYAKDAIANDVTITYTVPNAGWSPTYDIRVEDISKPANLFYKANVYQNSGVKWDNVRLTLSTGDPNQGADAPVIAPWYLSFYHPAVGYKSKEALLNTYAVGAAPRTETYEDKEAGKDMAWKPSTMNEYVAVDNSGINTSFDIDLPYTIMNDGKQHIVAIKKYDVPATYRYYAVPRLDKDAFLQAQVTNWEDLNIIPGQTNIYYEGTYVGQGYIDVRNTTDTLTFSLGRDKKIVVRREQDKKLRSVKNIGSNVRETFAYTISVRNTRKDVVNIVIQDQLPVSNDKDIVIEDKETGSAELEEATGILKWTLSLKPNESKSLPFGYTVKYPKGRQVSGLR